MSWRDAIKVQASWKNIAFAVTQSSIMAGFDFRQNSAPDPSVIGSGLNSLKSAAEKARDAAPKPFFEALGKRPREYQVEAVFFGDDYIDRKEAFIDAVQSGTPGTLQLPTEAPIEAICLTTVISFNMRDLGVESIFVTFVEQGEFPLPSNDTATQSQSLSKAFETIGTVGGEFEDGYSVQFQPAYVQTSAVSNIQKFINTTRSIMGTGSAKVLESGSRITSYSTQLGELQNSYDLVFEELNNLEYNASNTANNAVSMNEQYASILDKVSKSFNDPRSEFGALLGIFNNFDLSSKNIIVANSPAKVAERNNQLAMQVQVQTMAISNAVRVLARLNFATIDDAIDVRNKLTSAINNLQLTVGDSTGYGVDFSSTYNQLTSLRAAIWNDIARRTAALAIIKKINIKDATPAIVLAAELYGDSSRYDEITSRNAIGQSLFVDGDIEVLSN